MPISPICLMLSVPVASGDLIQSLLVTSRAV
jgi:hypothetical protein